MLIAHRQKQRYGCVFGVHSVIALCSTLTIFMLYTVAWYDLACFYGPLLKSSRSLSSTYLHLILVTKRSRSWSWMTSFCSMSIGPPIPEIWLFQNLTMKIQGQGHGQGQTQWLHLMPRIKSICLLSFCGNLTIFGWDMANSISALENLRSRSWPR